jgi:hypothetical protein
MNSSNRGAAATQALQLYLYRRALHPELFPPKGRATITHGGSTGYELEAWILSGGHVLRFRHGAFTCSELLVDHDDNLPIEGAVTGFPCSGEHEFQHRFLAEHVGYSTAVQTETLSENLYRSTYDDMLDYAKQTNSLTHKYLDLDGRKCLSLIELQHFAKEVHCQSFHLIAGTGLVLRTQTIFDCK